MSTEEQPVAAAESAEEQPAAEAPVQSAAEAKAAADAAVEAVLISAMPRYRWTADAVAHFYKGKLAGKNFIVTGATSGIGIPTVLALAKTGCNLTFTARDEKKGADVLQQVKDAGVPDGQVQCQALDLSSYASVAAFAAAWGDKPLHCLLHNAGVMASPHTLTADGEEQQMQVNFLSVVQLTELLRPRLAEKGRVVVVSSSAHKRGAAIPEFSAHLHASLAAPGDVASYEKWMAYSVAKSAVLMYSNALNAELAAAGQGQESFSVHPGGIMTGLQTNLSQEELQTLGWADADGNAPSAFKTPEQGASTSVWCALSPELNGQGGSYCENCDVTPQSMVGVMPADANAGLLNRVMGTAPHVWKPEACRLVAASARQHLQGRGLLPASGSTQPAA